MRLEVIFIGLIFCYTVDGCFCVSIEVFSSAKFLNSASCLDQQENNGSVQNACL